MGVGRFFKSLFDAEVMGEEIISMQEKIYSKMKNNYPSAEPHTLLAQVWLSRMISNGKDPNEKGLQTAAYSETIQFSCISPPNHIRALGLYFIYKERPDIIKSYPQFATEFNIVMEPIFEAMENGSIKELYRRYNPEIASKEIEDVEPNINRKHEEFEFIVAKLKSADIVIQISVGHAINLTNSTFIDTYSSPTNFQNQAESQQIPFLNYLKEKETKIISVGGGDTLALAYALFRLWIVALIENDEGMIGKLETELEYFGEKGTYYEELQAEAVIGEERIRNENAAKKKKISEQVAKRQRITWIQDQKNRLKAISDDEQVILTSSKAIDDGTLMFCTKCNRIHNFSYKIFDQFTCSSCKSIIVIPK